METKTYTLTEEQIAQGFLEYNKAWIQNPDGFGTIPTEDGPELVECSKNQANALLGYILKAMA